MFTGGFDMTQWFTNVWLLAAEGQAPPAGSEPAPGGLGSMMPALIVIMVLFYF